MRRRRAVLPTLLAAALAGAALAADPPTATPDAILDAARPAEWRAIAPEDLLVIDVRGGGRVVVALAPGFAPAHVAAIRALTRARWFDAAAIDRVQDGYVVQWGDADGTRPLPATVPLRPPAEYDRPAAGLSLVPLGARDPYAPQTGMVGPFPVASAAGRAWIAHCYGIVGVGRDLPPDTGSGAELYAVIGQAPRWLDRNLALVGRVVAGMDVLASLPRGTGPLGFYADPRQRVPFTRVAVAADLPAAERPAFRYLAPGSVSFGRWLAARANRRDAFFVRPAGAIDLCSALPPVRPVEVARR